MKLVARAVEAASQWARYVPMAVEAIGKRLVLPSTPENSNYTAARLEVNARACGAGV